MTTATLIKVTDFTGGIGWRNKTTIMDASFAAKAGEVVAIVGPSGSGKSTLLKHCAGLMSRRAVVSGSIEWADSKGKLRTRPSRGLVTYTPAKDMFEGSHTVLEALTIHVRLVHSRRLSLALCREKAQEISRRFGLTTCENNRIGTLDKYGVSAGQRKRLALALDSVGNPQLFVVDEPTSGVDAHAAVMIMNILRQAVSDAQLPTAVMCVLHQPSFEVFHAVDRVVVLAAGRTAFQGTPSGAVAYFGLEYFDRFHPKSLPLCTPWERVFTVPHGLQMQEVSTGTPWTADGPPVEVWQEKKEVSPSSNENQLPPRSTLIKMARVYQQFCPLLQRHARARLRESGYFRSTLLIFVVMALLIGAVYWRAGHRAEEFFLLPQEPVLPPLDEYFPRQPPPTPLSLSGAIKAGLSTLLYGIDGAGSAPHIDFVFDGVDGNFSKPIYAMPQLMANHLPTFIPCVHRRLKLEEIYPPTKFDIPGWKFDPDDSALDAAEQLIMGYQLIDYLYAEPWKLALACFKPTTTNLALKLQWFCFLQRNPRLFQSIVQCAGLPPLPIIASAKLDEEATATTEAATATTEAATATSEGARTGIGMKFDSFEDGWNSLMEIMPINMSPSELIAKLIWPVGDVTLTRSVQNLASSLTILMEKMSPQQCILPICEILPLVEPIASTLLIQILKHGWAVINMCGLIFVVSAVVGCWSLESALYLADARENANKDIYNGYYLRFVFGIARMTIDSLAEVWPIILFTIIVYFMAGLEVSAPSFFKFLGASLLTTFAAGGLVSFCSSFCVSRAGSVALSTMALTVALLLSGFVLRATANSDWQHVLGYFSMFRHGYSAMVLSVLGTNGYGIMPPWVATNFFGGVRESADFGTALIVLTCQGFIYRLAALSVTHCLHTKVGLKN